MTTPKSSTPAADALGILGRLIDALFAPPRTKPVSCLQWRRALDTLQNKPNPNNRHYSHPPVVL